ncbi:hypothetical protein NXG22_30905, partial [Klebsiella pneumoniae]|nr:hypothetical protein [Klebsiella pneumoniae]
EPARTAPTALTLVPDVDVVWLPVSDVIVIDLDDDNVASPPLVAVPSTSGPELAVSDKTPLIEPVSSARLAALTVRSPP